MRQVCLIFLLSAVIASPSFAADLESRLNGLEEVLKKQQKTIEEQQKMIEQLKGELASVKKQEIAAVPEKMPAILPEAGTAPPTGRRGASSRQQKRIQRCPGYPGCSGGRG